MRIIKQSDHIVFLLHSDFAGLAVEFIDEISHQCDRVVEGRLLVALEVHFVHRVLVQAQPHHLLVSACLLLVGGPLRSQFFLGGEGGRGHAGPSVFGLVVVALMLQVHDHKFVLGLLKLALQSGHLFLVGLLVLLEFDLQEGQFLHGLFHPLLVLAEHGIGCSRFGLQSFVDVLKLDDFALELFELGFEVVAFPLDEFQLLLQRIGLRLLLFLGGG